MQKKFVPAVFLLTGLSTLIFSNTGEKTSAASSAETQSQVTDASPAIKAEPGTPDGVLMMQAQALFGILPSTMPGSEHDIPAMIALGKKLYFEEDISINKTQSCNSCHPIDNKSAGADHLKTGKGALGKSSTRNDPPTMNAGFQIAQFWDGRAATLADQAKGPPLNPIEMAMPDGEAVAERLKSIAPYPADFKKAFPGEKKPITFDNFAKAVAAFERTLITRGRIDRFIAGDRHALTAQEMEGMRTFINAGCVQCHSGPNLGGMTFQKMGVFHKYANIEDYGRFQVTNNERSMSSKFPCCGMSPFLPPISMTAR
jgi:cytochrome c peroxidase